MKTVLKRVGAYFIDIMLVSLVATLLSSNAYINKDYNKYEKVYNEYKQKYDSYENYYTKLENYYEDKKLTEKEYNNLLKLDSEYINDLNNYYEDKKLEVDEYDKLIQKLNIDYAEIETNYSYKLLKYSIIPTVVNLMCVLLYFVVFQFYFNGQTLGKKIMKLKVVSSNEKKLSILNYLLRCLIVNEVFINIVSILCLVVLSKNNYIVSNKIIYIVTYILEMVILFMMVFDKSNRGLHDYISNTKVIEDKKE